MNMSMPQHSSIRIQTSTRRTHTTQKQILRLLHLSIPILVAIAILAAVVLSTNSFSYQQTTEFFTFKASRICQKIHYTIGKSRLRNSRDDLIEIISGNYVDAIPKYISKDDHK